MSASIKSQEQLLFHGWREHCRSHAQDGFVADGLVNEEAYSASRQKVLFVLKDTVGDLANYDKDLCEFIRHGARGPTFNNLTRWLKGIRGLPERIPWDQLAKTLKTTDDNDPSDARANELLSAAFMNIKKEPGKSKAKYPQLWKAADRDRLYIQRQFLLYDPDITICCGTDYYFVEMVLGHPKSIWNHTTDTVRFFEREPGKFIVAYRHPQSHYTVKTLYSDLMSALYEIL